MKVLAKKAFYKAVEVVMYSLFKVLNWLSVRCATCEIWAIARRAKL